ncbi:hypothetical protein GCM10017667_69840 [Streptomyces filamentosus]|uniref:Uncharacterized protein n=2 Tax=Streptomyces filamentosus TaxID=67294 RepID=A0A919BYC2_STRFL|nr:hypothetical protein GCM10017667_69840 [Streptomyces filamentosus]
MPDPVRPAAAYGDRHDPRGGPQWRTAARGRPPRGPLRPEFTSSGARINPYRGDSRASSLSGMPLFRRAKKSDSPAASPVPGWCSWFSPAEWQTFQALLSDVFVDGTSSGPPLVLGADRVLRLAGPDGSPVTLDLSSLAVALRDAPQDRWRSRTVEFVEERLHRGDEREALYAGSFDPVRHLLLPRVVRAEHVSDDLHDLAFPLTREMSTVLAIRLEGGLAAPVPPGQIDRWGATPQQAWDAALANLRALPLSLEDDGGANPMVSVTDPAGFTCTHLLRAAEILGRPAPHGILVMVPHEGFLMMQAVDGPELKWSVIGYSEVTLQRHDEAPEAARLCPRVLWIHEDRIESVGVTPAPPGSDAPGTISGSEEFVRLLSSFDPPGRGS